jgi:hypothetical protein
VDLSVRKVLESTLVKRADIEQQSLDRISESFDGLVEWLWQHEGRVLTEPGIEIFRQFQESLPEMDWQHVKNWLVLYKHVAPHLVAGKHYENLPEEMNPKALRESLEKQESVTAEGSKAAKGLHLKALCADAAPIAEKFFTFVSKTYNRKYTAAQKRECFQWLIDHDLNLIDSSSWDRLRKEHLGLYAPYEKN